MKDNLIYGLRDPRNDVYRYIGKTTIGYGRPLKHLVKSHNVLVNEWVEELNMIGSSPFVDIIENNIPLEELPAKETYWIKHYSELGSLFNGGSRVYDSIVEPSILSYDDISKTYLSLLNIGEAYKKIKMYYGFSDDEIASLLNVGRKTVYLIRKSNIRVTLETIIRLFFFANKTMDMVYDFYINHSNEYKGDLPDTKEDFLNECYINESFLRYWADKYFKFDCNINKIKYNKRSPKRKKIT
jgi:transcriptional regulator with XRE-family HTH domain